MYTHSQCLGLAEGGRTVTGTDWNYIEWTVQMSTDTVLLGNKLIPLKLQKLPDPTVTSRQCFVLCTFVICHYTAQWRHSNGDAENTRTWKWSENLVQLKEKKKAREQKSNILFKTFFSIFFSIFFFTSSSPCACHIMKPRDPAVQKKPTVRSVAYHFEVDQHALKHQRQKTVQTGRPLSLKCSFPRQDPNVRRWWVGRWLVWNM